MEVISGVYSIQNNVSGKMYVGSSKNIYKRWEQHKKCLNNHKHHSMDLQNDWDKQGEKDFSFNILLQTDLANAKKYEREYIDKMQLEKFGYNVAEKGGYKQNIKKRLDMECRLLKNVINNYYIPDGNVFCYDVFEIADKLKWSVSYLIHFLGIDSCKCFNKAVLIDDETAVQLNWDNDNIYLTACNVCKFRQKEINNEDIDYIYLSILEEIPIYLSEYFNSYFNLKRRKKNDDTV